MQLPLDLSDLWVWFDKNWQAAVTVEPRFDFDLKSGV